MNRCLNSLGHQDLNDLKAQNRRKQARKREQAQREQVRHLNVVLL